jgi:hypothetical protein
VIKPLQDGGSTNVLVYEIKDYKDGSIKTFIKEVLGTKSSYGKVNTHKLLPNEKRQ